MHGVEDLVDRERPLVFGGIAATGLDLTTLLAFDLLGADVESTFGFEGRGPVNLALQRGEVDIDYQTTSSYGPAVEPLVKDGTAVPLFSLGQVDEDGKIVRDPNFPDIPTVVEAYEELYGEQPDADRLATYRAILALTYTYQKALWVPEETPDEAVELLRTTAEDDGRRPGVPEVRGRGARRLPARRLGRPRRAHRRGLPGGRRRPRRRARAARDLLRHHDRLRPPMTDAAFSALASLADPSLLIMLAIGVVAGLVIGLIPGLGGTGAVAILLPVTFGMEPEQALAMLIGALAVVHTSDTVAAVLLGAPGSASASVTMLDGYSMARKGQAKRALSLAFLSSMAGGLIGAVGLTLAIPLARPLVLSFGSPELFMLTILGVSLAAVLSRGNVVKGLTAGFLGLLLGMVGTSPTTAEERFTFGSLFLGDGISLVAVALGIFGLAEIASRVGQRRVAEQPVALERRLGIGHPRVAHALDARHPRRTHRHLGRHPARASAPRPAPGWPTARRSPPPRTSASSARATRAASSARRAPTTPSRPATSSRRSSSASPAACRPRCCSGCC